MPEPRFRLDAAAGTLALAGAVAAVAVAGYRPLTGVADNPLGPAGNALAGAIVNAVGDGAVVLIGGYWVLLAMYVARRGWLRLAVRAVGWGLLTVTTAAAADLAGEHLGGPTPSAFGKGGSVGAVLRVELDARVPPPVPGFVLAGSGFLGLLLAADGVFRRLLRRAPRTAKPAAPPKVESNPFQNTLPKKRPERAPPPAPAVVPPPVREPEAGPEDDDEDDEDDDLEIPPPVAVAAIPITKHDAKPTDTPAPLRVIDRKAVGPAAPVEEPVEVSLETGLRLNKVTALADDLALNMGVPSVRVVAPLPHRTTVGVEIPNEHRQAVRLKEVILATSTKAAKFKLPIFLGKDVEGKPLVYDMATMPHLLIAGRTGTGKSVCLNTVLMSFLLTRTADECRLILIDPKKVEFADYGRLPHLMTKVVTDQQKAEAILGWAVDKMEERYDLLSQARVRNIAAYNELSAAEILKRVPYESTAERDAIPLQLPYIVVVIDEVGDLLMSSMKKEVESHIIRLAQKSRAAGIHLILATQKPTVDVITGLIKSNLPARICFQVASRADSMVVLDEKGADKLLGMGDMLFLQPGTSTIIRGQGAYVDDREIERVTTELSKYEPNFESELLNIKTKDQAGGGVANLGDKLRDRDELYEQAIEIVVREQRGSTSLLQRALGIGYGRASRLIDFMAEDGLVGAFNGSSARDVLVSPEEWESRKT